MMHVIQEFIKSKKREELINKLIELKTQPQIQNTKQNHTDPQEVVLKEEEEEEEEDGVLLSGTSSTLIERFICKEIIKEKGR